MEPSASSLADPRPQVLAPTPVPVTGMAFGMAAYALFSAHDAGIKWLVTSIPGRPELVIWEVLFARSLVIVTGLLLVGRRKLVTRALVTPEKPRLLLRGPILILAWLCYYSSARVLPLAQLQTLYYAAPIVATLLAMPMLGERVPPNRWIAIAAGFLGVVVAADPGGITASFAAARVLFAASCWGFAIILMRQVARREGSLLQMLYMNVMFLLATSIACAVHVVAPDGRQLLVLGFVGLAGAAGQFCLFEGARRAPASIMASVEYTALIWAFVLGWVVFHDTPRMAVFLGAALIAAAGFWLVATERRRAQAS